MPTFYFNLDDHVRDEDEEGTELPDEKAARNQAVVFAGEWLSDHPELLDATGKFRIEVLDAERRHLLDVTVSADPA